MCRAVVNRIDSFDPSAAAEIVPQYIKSHSLLCRVRLEQYSYCVCLQLSIVGSHICLYALVFGRKRSYRRTCVISTEYGKRDVPYTLPFNVLSTASSQKLHSTQMQFSPSVCSAVLVVRGVFVLDRYTGIVRISGCQKTAALVIRSAKIRNQRQHTVNLNSCVIPKP